TGPVFCSLGPVWLRSFSSHETRIPNTTHVDYIHMSHVVDTHYQSTIYPASYMLGKHLAPFHLVMRVYFRL
ncbi:hypothetical protein K443DRAFT_97689, partial [Laccaria amethystina LaAM-08-1]